jgi:acyl dehydratase
MSDTTTIRELSGTPNVLAGYARAFGSALPLAGHLPLVSLPGGGGELPDLELRVPALRTDLDHLAAYAKVCGFTLRDTLPATYLNVRAFPVHIALMTDGAFPFGPVGLVHLTNEIVHHRPVHVREELALRVWTTGLDPHPKGRTLTLHTEASASGGEIVWEGRSTMLHRSHAPGGTGERLARTPDPDVPASATWRIPGDQGRRYAAVSGDRNPIHLYGVTAKPFGFPRAIAHGLWTKARALAALEAQLPDAFTAHVEFRKPVLLPTTVTFGSATDAEGVTAFAVKDARKGSAHLVGTVTPAAAPKRAKKKTPAKKNTSGRTSA